MAPKRPSPLEEPPSASETEEEEELNGSEEEDEDEEEEPPTPIQSSLKNPNPNKISLPKPQPPSSSSSDDDGDSDDENADLPQDSDSEDDGSDSDNEPVKHMIAHRNADVKPISSKPMLDAPKSKKPAPAAATTPVPTKAPAKRPLEGDNGDKKSKKKKVSEFDEDDDSEKKTGKLFQRIWSDEDEIIILNGLIDFKKKGYSVSNNMGAFFDFIKDSLHVDVSKSQLNNKLQRLKQKYQNNANRAKPGEDPVISRPHEVKSYRLSKEIWGEHSGKVDGLEANQVTSDSGNPDVKKTKKPVNTNNIASPKQKVSIASPKQKVSTLPDDKAPKVEAKEADSGSGLEYHYLNQSLKFRNDPMMPVPPLDLGEIVAKKGWDSVKSLDATSLNKRWKEVMIAETKAYLARIDLVREQTKLMLDELQSSDS